MALGRSVRALLEVHVLTSFNSGLRNAGIALAALAVGALMLLWGVFAAFIAGFAFVGGLTLGPMVAEGRAGFAGLAFTGAVVVGPMLSLAGGDGRELEWERFKLFPVTPAALFISELIAMIGHPIMAIVALGQAVFAVGLIVGAPEVWVVAVPTALACFVAQAALRLVAASTAVRFMRRFRVAALFVFVLMPLPIAFVLQEVQQAREKATVETLAKMSGQLDETLQLADGLMASLPASAMLRVPIALKQHEWLEVAGGTVVPLLLLALLATLAVRGVLAESSETTTSVSKGPERLWTFKRPEWGIARLQLLSLFDSQLGRFSLGVPFLWILPVFLAARMESEFPSHYLGLFAWVFVPTAMAGFLFNQFGLDRGAVKGLFLLPISDLSVIRGKAVGYALFQSLQLVAVWLASWALLRAPGYVLVAGPLTAAYVFLVLLTVGQWTSTIWPRVIPRKSLKQAQGGFVFALVSIGALGGTMAPVSALWFALAPSTPWALPPALLAVDLVALLVQQRFSREAARMLALRRERIVESLG